MSDSEPQQPGAASEPPIRSTMMKIRTNIKAGPMTPARPIEVKHEAEPLK